MTSLEDFPADSAPRSGGLAVLDRPSVADREPGPAPPLAARDRRGRRLAIIVGAAALVAFSAIGGVTAAALSKSVTITVDGVGQQVTTVASSVDAALSAAGIDVGDHDVVSPALGALVEDGDRIALERARPLTLTIDGVERTVWTTADTLEEALLQLGQDPAALRLSADRARDIPLEGLAVRADPLRTVTLTIGGQPAAAVDTGARTVADLLAEEGVQLTPTDTVTPGPSTALTDGLSVVVARVQVETITTAEPIPAGEQRVDDPAATAGTEAVAQQGAAGEAQVVTEVTTTNGVETSRSEVSRSTLRQPVPTVVKVGTKSTLEWRGSRVFFNDNEFGVNWDGLAFCESTNNPGAVNNPAGYPSTYGLFQFDQSTWGSVGGTGSPLDATPEEQLIRAKLLYQQRGLEPWLCAPAAASLPPA